MLLFFIHFKDTLEMWIFTANVLNPINIVVLKILSQEFGVCFKII